MSKTRSIVITARTTVLLAAVSGLFAFLSTHWINNPPAGNGTLFGLAWGFSAFGVAVSGFCICVCLRNNFGKPTSISSMLGSLAAAFVCGCIIVGFIGAIACTYDIVNEFGERATAQDSTVFVCIFGGFQAGLLFGFFTLLGIHLNNSWTGENNVTPMAQPTETATIITSTVSRNPREITGH